MQYQRRNHQNRRPSTKPIEARFNRILRELRHIRPNTDMNLEKEIAYLTKQIQDYGFTFFPNHFLFNTVAELEQKVRMLKAIKLSSN